MKALLKFILSKKVFNYIKILTAYFYDLSRFYKYSALNGFDNSHKLQGKIVERYHAIEKGLTMPSIRLGFGEEKIYLLTEDCLLFLNKYGENAQVTHAIGVIREYFDFHELNNYDLSDNLLIVKAKLDSISKRYEPTKQKRMTRDKYFKYIGADFALFSNSRHSLRNFNETNIPLNLLKEAIELASNAPSACNRQTSKCYIFEDKPKIVGLLDLQGGSKGFNHLTNKLIIVTAELGVFGFANERNQAFIDGGIFVMNLLYSLHFLGIGACILNCSTSPVNDRKIREMGCIEDSQVLIAMISCGYPPDNFSVALSKRNPVADTLKIF